MGLRDLQSWNESLFSKVHWDIQSDRQSLWKNGCIMFISLEWDYETGLCEAFRFFSYQAFLMIRDEFLANTDSFDLPASRLDSYVFSALRGC